MRLACLLVIVVGSCHLAHAGSDDSTSPVDDFRYKRACGPIACFVAARYLDRDISLQQAAEACHWTTGDTTSLQQIHDAIRTLGLTCKAQRMSPDELCRYLQAGTGVAILPIRKFSEESNHVIVALESANNYVTTVDYPELIREEYVDSLADKWDGQVLCVSRRSTRDGVSLPFAAAMACLAAAIAMRFSVRKRKRPLTGLSVALFSCVLPVLTSAAEGARPPEVKIENSIQDFGLIKEGQVLTHSFTITNVEHEFLHPRIEKNKDGLVLVVSLEAPVVEEGTVVKGEVKMAIGKDTYLGIPYFAYIAPD